MIGAPYPMDPSKISCLKGRGEGLRHITKCANSWQQSYYLESSAGTNKYFTFNFFPFLAMAIVVNN